METDPALETCTESRAETGGEETREGPFTRPSPLSPNRSTAAHTPTALTSTPPQLTSSCPPKLTPAPNPSSSTLILTPTFTPFSSSTPTPNPPKLTPTPSPPPTLTHKTPPTLTSTVLNPTPTFTPTSPSLTPNNLTSKILTPRPTLPTLTPTLPTLKHSSSPSPTKLTHKPQALLLGRSPCSSRDQMLLRAQMLQSLTLRPSAPGTLTIPPSLRLKPPSSSLSPISRPLTPLFPPLRPRTQPSSMATDRQTPPTRRLSVPPPSDVVNSSSSLFLPPVLSSLSSQSPPASPCLTPPSDFPPPLLPVSPSHSETLSLSESRSETISLSEREPWTQRVWPEGGRRVLTHLVEGFIIQEGLQAFPVNRSSLLLGGQEGVSQNGNTEGAELLPLTDTPQPPEHSSESERVGVRQRGVLQCESCGKRGHAHSFHRSKRYCSTSCARSAHRRDYEGEEGHAVPITTRLERRAARRARRASEPAMTPSNPTVTSTEPTPAQWSVEQVWDFIHTLPGCVDVAEAFRVQEIDGQALLLLTEDHLMTSMNIKLGPALKICAHINTLRHT
uniref:Protein PRRC2C n=1 Tax=Oncorhynchus kisutch TaxID=8019 RepID=A0A8C7LCD9_ONCKI